MAIMFLNVTSVSRGRGGSAVAKAAYIARERLSDARSGVVRDYRQVRGLEHAEILLPSGQAAGLARDHGIGRGDRVAVLGANSLEWILTFWAVTALGGITVAMNGWWQADEILHGLEVAKPKLLVADAKRLARLVEEGIDPKVPTVVIESGAAATWGLADFASLRAGSAGAALPDGPVDEDDPVAILFTSGTTGRPKGAISTHRNLVAFTMLGRFGGARTMLMHPPDPAKAAAASPMVALCSSPLFHVSGLQSAAIAGIANGTTMVWTTGRFDPGKVLDLVVEHGVTRLGGITTQLWRVLEHPDIDRYDLSRITSTGGGGSTFSPELQRTIRAKLPNAVDGFTVGYGLTECGGLCTIATNEMMLAHPDCVGRALLTAQVAILDDDGRMVPDGVDGNICVRGPMVMPGYWDNPEATAAAFFADGWLRTGDVGHLADGLVFLATRKRDLIIRGGENIYPVEIENRLDEHPSVAEAAVVGVDHRTLGQQVKAIVVPRPGHAVDAEEIKAFVAETLAYYKVPEFIELRTEPLPRNATGKVMKHVLDGADNTFIEE